MLLTKNYAKPNSALNVPYYGAETERSQVQVHPGPHSQFYISLCNVVIPCLSKIKGKKVGGRERGRVREGDRGKEGALEVRRSKLYLRY